MNSLKIAHSKVRLLPLQQTTDEWNTQTIQALVFEPLTRWHNGGALPALAHSWEILDNGRRWRFHLRPEARFHDGAPCTTADVITTLDRTRSAKDSFGMAGPYAKYLVDLTLQALDAHTLEILSPQPNGDLTDFLNEIYISREDGQGRPVNGTGPYRVAEYTNAEDVHLERVRAASPAGPHYDRLTFFQMAEAEERWEALTSGRVDFAVDLDQLEHIPPQSGLTWLKKANTLSVTFFLNGFEAPFNNPLARLAANLAVDVEQIIHDVWHGLAIPAASIVSPFHFGVEPDIKPIPTDRRRARELFEQAGAPSGLLLRTPTFMPERAEKVSRLVADHLAAAGVKVNMEVMTDRPEYARQVGAKKIGHLALFDSSPHSTYRVLFDKISSRQRAVWWQGVEDPTADEMIAGAHLESEPEARRAAYTRILRHLNQNPPWLYLYHPILACAARPAVQGVELTHSGLLKFAGAWD